MTSNQHLKIKSFVTDTNNYLNEIFLSFDSLNSEFLPGSRLIDIFYSCISIYKAYYCNKESKAVYCCKLDNLVFNTLLDLNSVIVVSNTSIKNNIATSIAYIYSFSSLIKKILYHTIDITSIEAELFAIRCEINQAIQIDSFSHIIIITGTIYIAFKIFNSSVHLYHFQLIDISKDLRSFFDKHSSNSIKFWDYPNYKE